VVVFLVVVVVACAMAGPVVRVVTDMLEIALAAVGVVLVAGGAVAALVIRAHRRERREFAAMVAARRAARPVQLTSRVVPIRPGRPARPAVAPRRADIPALPRDDVSAHSRIDVGPRVVTGRVIRPRRPGRDERRS
jgi:hypothetical protein